MKWAPSILWLLILCWLSFIPSDKLNIRPIVGFDKVAHFFFYAILLSTFYWPLKHKLQKFSIALFAAIGIGGITELIQHFFVRNRTGDWWDFLANTVGAVVAYLVIRKYTKT